MKIRFSHWCKLAQKKISQRHDRIALRTTLILLVVAQFITEPGMRIAATAVAAIVVCGLYESLWNFAHDVYHVALRGEYGPDRVARD